MNGSAAGGGYEKPLLRPTLAKGKALQNIYRIQVKSIVQEFSTTIVTVFPEYRRLMKYTETCVIFSQHMGPRKWRTSFTTTLFLTLTEIKGEMFPKMSM